MDLNVIFILLPLLLGWIADQWLGDPANWPHPIIGFGKLIAGGEKRLNQGKHKRLKGALFSLSLILGSFVFMYFCLVGLGLVNVWLNRICSAIVIFYCLAGKTLREEVRKVFIAVDSSVDAGRQQVARIVGRDTSMLSPQQIRTAALETAAENLSDGVVAPLFWYLLLGVPGMFAYKMVNTLDSMIGYKNERYREFGCWAARIDDVANYLPARITAGLMILVSGRVSLFAFVRRFGKQHSSPNSGYPEAALAGILDCRFGGPNTYFGKQVDKPYIGNHPKTLTTDDMRMALSINKQTEIAMILLVMAGLFTQYLIQQ